jgi:hypothetical protein
MAYLIRAKTFQTKQWIFLCFLSRVHVLQTIIFLKLLILGARSRRSKRAVQPLEDDEDLPRDIAASIQVGSRLFLTNILSG